MPDPKNALADKKEKKARGLMNLGNTCFMNCVIQCLAHHPVLLTYFRDGQYKKDINQKSPLRGEIAEEFSRLLAEIWDDSVETRREPVTPRGFRETIQKYAPYFIGNREQDSQEFLIYLLQGLHDDVNKATLKKPPQDPMRPNLTFREIADESWRRDQLVDNSYLVDNFVGSEMSLTECLLCGHKKANFTPAWCLSLAIVDEESTDLRSCLKRYASKEVLKGENCLNCSRCGRAEQALKRLRWYRLPRILIIQFKRANRFVGSVVRSDSFVHFPIEDLDMAKFVSEVAPPQPCHYNLFAVSFHHGSGWSGHYTAACLNRVENKWFHCDDYKVREMDEEDVLSSDAYLLFYEQIPSTEYARYVAKITEKDDSRRRR